MLSITTLQTTMMTLQLFSKFVMTSQYYEYNLKKTIGYRYEHNTIATEYVCSGMGKLFIHHSKPQSLHHMKLSALLAKVIFWCNDAIKLRVLEFYQRTRYVDHTAIIKFGI